MSYLFSPLRGGCLLYVNSTPISRRWCTQSKLNPQCNIFTLYITVTSDCNYHPITTVQQYFKLELKRTRTLLLCLEAEQNLVQSQKCSFITYLKKAIKINYKLYKSRNIGKKFSISKKMFFTYFIVYHMKIPQNPENFPLQIPTTPQQIFVFIPFLLI